MSNFSETYVYKDKFLNIKIYSSDGKKYYGKSSINLANGLDASPSDQNTGFEYFFD